MKNIIISIIVLILILPSVFSSDYTRTGDNGFATGEGQYQAGTQTTTTTKTIGSVIYPPLIGDVTGDGNNEVITIVGGTVTIRNGSNLLNARSQGTGYSSTSNILIFDIDGDGINEILIGEDIKLDPASNRNISISIINVSSTNALLQNTIILDVSTGSFNYDGGEVVIGCETVNSCSVVALRFYETPGGTQDQAYAISFNSTSGGARLILKTSEDVDDQMCFPQVRYMDIATINNTVTYLVSYLEEDANSNAERQMIHAFSSTMTEIKEHLEIANTDIFATSDISNCESIQGIIAKEQITAPIVNGGLVWVGFQESVDQYKLRAYNEDGTEFDTYPAIEDGEGDLISNPFKMRAYPDDGEDTSTCVMGQDESAKDVRSTKST